MWQRWGCARNMLMSFGITGTSCRSWIFIWVSLFLRSSHQQMESFPKCVAAAVGSLVCLDLCHCRTCKGVWVFAPLSYFVLPASLCPLPLPPYHNPVMFSHAWLKVTSPPEAFMAKDGRAKCWEHAGFLWEPNSPTRPPGPWGSGCVWE